MALNLTDDELFLIHMILIEFEDRQVGRLGTARVKGRVTEAQTIARMLEEVGPIRRKVEQARGLEPREHAALPEAVCIECGCTDRRACIDESTLLTCRWIRLDVDTGRGVCSSCRQAVNRWDKGERA